MWHIEPIDVKDIGTDSTTADNFVHNTVDLTRTGITRDYAASLLKQEFKDQQKRMTGLAQALEQEKARLSANPKDPMIEEIDYELKYAQPKSDAEIEDYVNSIDDPRAMNNGVALSVLGMSIRDRYYKEHNITGAVQACYAGFDALDIPQVVDGYKPRPLAGVWATPPFLHNGSVPNLYELLSPVKCRSKRFLVGSRDFDPVKVGFVTPPVDSKECKEPAGDAAIISEQNSPSGFWFDTSLKGNQNTGHEFSDAYVPGDPKPGVIGPALTPDQRLDIIEYLKIRQDNPPPAQSYQPVDCTALLHQAESASSAFQEKLDLNSK